MLLLPLAAWAIPVVCHLLHHLVILLQNYSPFFFLLNPYMF